MKATAWAVGIAAVAAGPFIGMTAAQAAPTPHTVYVAGHGQSTKAGPVFSSINQAIGAVATGGTVVVEKGTYHEDVAVTKAVRIEGQRGATVDATNLINGVKVTAPDVTVSGLTVENAVGEGILLQNTSSVTVVGNNVHTNDTGVRLVDPVANTYPFCQPQGAMANDCGENIHLVGSSHNVVQGNTVTDGAGGILLSDETGPTSHNLISGNNVADNHTACGVVLAGHNPAAAPGGTPAPTVAGVFGNTVIGNSISGNGLQGGGGAGVQLATGLPGGAVYQNTVTLNAINGNGHSGVTLHSHAPGQYLNGNVVTANQIGTNNLNGDKDFTPQDNATTGIFVGTAAPVSITVRDNVISNDKVGIFTTGPVTATGERGNVFLRDAVSISTN
ncbi:nitrous oxide reductase family maturation protein NosD [Streptomyces sp. NBC_01190]|uniref:right-handed parallel beta-helix repeat-containing protein n=1 Tax=Streptomyces sp. NBC_01190 TaxID=2903767 RepID=UPI00386DC049|nr:right-handed parallel beta-helix repeat-containing protein [Streptomyces sp. NBC_01190]